MKRQEFNPYDECLTCGRRVGAHTFTEMEDCLARRGFFGDDEE